MNQNNISLEKVIKGLEYHSEGNCFKSDDDETGCPYWKDSFCSQHLCSDALALLKDLNKKLEETQRAYESALMLSASTTVWRQ